MVQQNRTAIRMTRAVCLAELCDRGPTDALSLFCVSVFADELAMAEELTTSYLFFILP
jgi:hypothetical protein